jgi:hypothetical protein
MGKLKADQIIRPDARNMIPDMYRVKSGRYDNRK